MDDRLKLHDTLLLMGTKNVYYQPPSNITMVYPAIVYNKNKIENVHADDIVYYQHNHYTIIVISKTVDDIITSNISKLPKCRFDRYYTQDGLYHTTFNLYY